MAWNRGSGGAAPVKTKAKKPSPIRGIVAGALVCVLAVGAYFAFFSGSEKPQKEVVEKQPTKIKEVKPAVVVTNQPVATKPSTRPILGKTPTGEEYVAVNAQTNNSGIVDATYELPNGEKKRVIQLQTRESVYFDSDFDLMLSMIADLPLDHELPPMPDIGDMEEAFRKAVKVPIIIKETDSEEIRRKKESVIQLRQQIADLLAEGYTVRQVLDEHNTLRQMNVEIRREHQNELNRIWKSGDKEGAREYMKTMNKALEQRGILPLNLPSPRARGTSGRTQGDTNE